MKLAFRTIEPFVKKPDPKALAVLIYGPDEGLVRERMDLLTRSVVEDIHDPFNVVEFPASVLAENPSRLLDEAQSISMLGGRRVIRVRDAGDAIAKDVKQVLESLRPGDNFILIEADNLAPRSSLRSLFESADNAAALPCYVDDERDLSKVIADGLRQAGYTISSDALTFMAANIVGDRAIARSEIDKLITYMGPANKNISLDDVTACVGYSAALPIDDLLRHIGTGQFAEADRVLGNLLAEDFSVMAIVRAMQNHFMRLHTSKIRMQKGESMDMALAKLRPPLFFKHKPAFEAQLAGLSQAQIEQALNAIISAEARCKQTGSDQALILSRTLLSLCQLVGRATARRRA